MALGAASARDPTDERWGYMPGVLTPKLGNSEALHVSRAPQPGSPAQLTHPTLASVPSLSHVPSQCPQFESKSLSQGFPGGAVVENLPANAGDTGSSPGLGGSHMPRSN